MACLRPSTDAVPQGRKQAETWAQAKCRRLHAPMKVKVALAEREVCMADVAELDRMIVALRARVAALEAIIQAKGGTVTIQAPTNLVILAGSNLEITAGSSFAVTAGSNLDLAAGSNFSLSTGGKAAFAVGAGYSMSAQGVVNVTCGASSTVSTATAMSLSAGHSLAVKTGDMTVAAQGSAKVQVHGNASLNVGKKLTTSVTSDYDLTGHGSIGLKALGPITIKGSKIIQ